MTPEELAKLLAENDELGIDTKVTAIEENPYNQPVTVEEFDAKPTTTRPIGKLSYNKMQNLHKYHCPDCGAMARSGVTYWNINGVYNGTVHFECKHITQGELK